MQGDDIYSRRVKRLLSNFAHVLVLCGRLGDAMDYAGGRPSISRSACFAARAEWKNDRAAHGQANSHTWPGAEEDDLGDGWGLEEFGAEGARGVTRGFVS